MQVGGCRLAALAHRRGVFSDVEEREESEPLVALEQAAHLVDVELDLRSLGDGRPAEGCVPVVRLYLLAHEHVYRDTTERVDVGVQALAVGIDEFPIFWVPALVLVLAGRDLGVEEVSGERVEHPVPQVRRSDPSGIGTVSCLAFMVRADVVLGLPGVVRNARHPPVDLSQREADAEEFAGAMAEEVDVPDVVLAERLDDGTAIHLLAEQRGCEDGQNLSAVPEVEGVSDASVELLVSLLLVLDEIGEDRLAAHCVDGALRRREDVATASDHVAVELIPAEVLSERLVFLGRSRLRVRLGDGEGLGAIGLSHRRRRSGNRRSTRERDIDGRVWNLRHGTTLRRVDRGCQE